MEIVNNKSNQLLQGIEQLIEQTGRQVAVYLNTTISRLYWSIGNYIIAEIQYETYSQYRQQIVATLSQTLTEKYGKGYTYSALNRMVKVAERQKRIPIDSVDYSLDLLFFHRKQNRLIAIDLKLGKFQPKYKGQMELYLKYLQKHDRQPHKNSPVGYMTGNVDELCQGRISKGGNHDSDCKCANRHMDKKYLLIRSRAEAVLRGFALCLMRNK